MGQKKEKMSNYIQINRVCLVKQSQLKGKCKTIALNGTEIKVENVYSTLIMLKLI